MSLWLDQSYLKQISFRLEKFKEKRPGTLYNCKCVLCGDSSKKANKIRGYFIAKNNQLQFYCHNCGASMSFAKFLNKFDFNLYEQYNLEKFKENGGDLRKPKVDTDANIIKLMKAIPKTQKFIPDVCAELKSISELSSSHPARQYVESRQIPAQFHSELYYAPKFFEWTKGHTDKFKSTIKSSEHPRLIIPWYTSEGMLFAYSARSFGDEQPRYYNIVLDEQKPKFYGLNRVDVTKKQYVVEGQIDSMFLPNCVAVGNSTLYHYHSAGDVTYIPDRDTRNKEVMKIVKKMIDMGLKVCMLPLSLKGKDINLMMTENNLTQNELLTIIDKNTHQGLEAELYFTKWKEIL
jgi:hypothetical protein